MTDKYLNVFRHMKEGKLRTDFENIEIFRSHQQRSKITIKKMLYRRITIFGTPIIQILITLAK